ncbi:MAG: bacteriocin [Proteobacteria bacterium]|nr:bacteriocin [Pseudomonadota bacterium]
MKKIKNKKLTLQLSTVRKLQETLSDDQLKAVVGGACPTTSGFTGSRGVDLC